MRDDRLAAAAARIEIGVEYADRARELKLARAPFPE